MLERIGQSGTKVLVVTLACVILCVACRTAPQEKETPENQSPENDSIAATDVEPERISTIDPFQAAAGYEYGATRVALSRIEEEIRIASPERLQEIEGRLIVLLQSKEATGAGKRFACRMLRRMGTGACVPALSALLPLDDLTDAARFALQGNASAQAGAALRDALKTLDNDKRIGVIGSLAQRRDAEAVPLVADFLDDDDPALVEACLSALGVMGTEEAATALMRATLPPDLETARDHACIECSYSLKNHGGKARASRLFSALTNESGPVSVRAAAWQGLCEAQGAGAVPALIALLDDPDERMREAACGILGRLPVDEKIDAALIEPLEKAKPRIRAALIQCLTAREVEGLFSILLKYTRDADRTTRLAAIHGLADTAGEGDLAPLVERLERFEEPEDRDAMEATIQAVISRLPEGEARTRWVRERFAAATGPGRIALLSLLGGLPDAHTLPTLVSALSDPDVEVRKTAYVAFSEWPDSAPLGDLLESARNESDPGLRTLAHRGIVRMLEWPADRPAEQTAKLYRTAASLAMDAEGLNVLISSSVNQDAPWVLDFIRPYLDRPGTFEVARKACRQATTALARKASHDAMRGAIKLIHPCSEKYDGGGDGALIDGRWGSTSYGDGRWLGFNGTDLIAVIDLNEPVRLKEVRLGYLQDIGSWIFPPEEVSISSSLDGRHFREIAMMKRAIPEGFGEPSIKDFHFELNGPSARFVKVCAKAIQACPAWHPGSGSPGWLFCDEIAINEHLDEHISR